MSSLRRCPHVGAGIGAVAISSVVGLCASFLSVLH